MRNMKYWINSEAAAGDIVLCSSIRLARNFKDLCFTDKLSLEEAKENVDKIYSILVEGVLDNNLELIKLWKQDYNYSKAFVEKLLISNKLLDRREKGGVVLSNDNTVSVMINEEDNLVIKCISDGLNLKEEYQFADKLDDIVEDKVRYAFHPEYGYLTASPGNVGSGLKATVLVHLPLLTANEEIDKISKGLNEVGMSITGAYNEKNQVFGNLYFVSNKVTLGVKEEEIVNNLESVVLNIVNEEKKNREIVMAKYSSEVEDRVFRAEAILKNAKLLNSKEILDLVSNVRLGVELGILNMEKRILNSIMVLTRDSIIESKIGSNSTIRDKNIERARIVNQILG
jgi:protein arginine kinase